MKHEKLILCYQVAKEIKSFVSRVLRHHLTISWGAKRGLIHPLPPDSTIA